MNKIKKLLHDYLGWGFPSMMDEYDTFQPTYFCAFCDAHLAQYPNGDYFHLTP